MHQYTKRQIGKNQNADKNEKLDYFSNMVQKIKTSTQQHPQNTTSILLPTSLRVLNMQRSISVKSINKL